MFAPFAIGKMMAVMKNNIQRSIIIVYLNIETFFFLEHDKAKLEEKYILVSNNLQNRLKP